MLSSLFSLEGWKLGAAPQAVKAAGEHGFASGISATPHPLL